MIPNPKTEPVNAKLLGIQNLSGKYMMVLDHDEVLVNPDSIRLRVELLEQHQMCKVAFCSGYKRPNDYPLLNEYISEFGDPFSLFIYNFSRGEGFLEKGFRRICDVQEDEETHLLLSFEHSNHLPIMELCCVATIVDCNWFKAHMDIDNNPQNLAHMFYIMLSKGFYEAILLKKDPLVHYSVDSFAAYYPKLKWRIRNNIHYADNAGSGFVGRQRYLDYTKNKKYLFIPYTVFIAPCLIHGIVLAFSRKNPVYMMHPLLCWYVLFHIVIEYTRKLLNMAPEPMSYDGKRVIGEE